MMLSEDKFKIGNRRGEDKRVLWAYLRRSVLRWGSRLLSLQRGEQRL